MDGRSPALRAEANLPIRSSQGKHFVHHGRVDAAVVTLGLERLAVAAGGGTVGTVGEVEVSPGIVNVVPGAARVSLDVRRPGEVLFRGVLRDIVAFAEQVAARRGGSVSYAERQSVPATRLDAGVVGALSDAAGESGAAYRRMHSGAAHDTMCVADRAPCAMVFVPCRDGISHSPEEDAGPADAAVAAEVVLNALVRLGARL
jgi:allantoate deiminase